MGVDRRNKRDERSARVIYSTISVVAGELVGALRAAIAAQIRSLKPRVLSFDLFDTFCNVPNRRSMRPRPSGE